MSEAKFTPAPWVMHEPQGLSCSWSFDFEAMELGISIELDEFKANTSLIESAPEMYEMLAEINYQLGAVYGDRIADLLSKARGEHNES
jgi:hypothetical protein